MIYAAEPQNRVYAPSSLIRHRKNCAPLQDVLCKGAYKTIQAVYSFCSPINAQVNNYLVFLRTLFLRLMPKAPLTTAHAPIILRGEKNGRVDWIRTSDLSVPNRALYQAEPQPDKTKRMIQHAKQLYTRAYCIKKRYLIQVS